MRRATAAGLLIIGVFFASGANGADEQHAGLLVRNPDGTTDQMCVAFDEPSITGADLLARSGIDYVAESSSVGTALCAIDGHGCERDDCFCEYPSFWGYWVRDPGEDAWRFSEVGAADREIVDGSMDGWSYGKDGKPHPDDAAFGDVCGGGVQAAASPTTRPESRNAASRGYGGFVVLAGLFAVVAAIQILLRRRRARP